MWKRICTQFPFKSCYQAELGKIETRGLIVGNAAENSAECNPFNTEQFLSYKSCCLCITWMITVCLPGLTSDKTACKCTAVRAVCLGILVNKRSIKSWLINRKISDGGIQTSARRVKLNWSEAWDNCCVCSRLWSEF